MLPFDRRFRFMASSVGLPGLLEGSRGCCRWGEPCAASHGVTSVGGNDSASGVCGSDRRL
jgi:hypothetical protein